MYTRLLLGFPRTKIDNRGPTKVIYQKPMKTKYKNKMMSSTDEKVEKKTKRSYTFPKEGITIKADSLEEAQKELEKRQSSDK